MILKLEDQILYMFQRGEPCMPCAWLSDFANEKEYLFGQMTRSLKISNIYDMRSGVEYEQILQAGSVINSLLGLFTMVADIPNADQDMWILVRAVLENE